MELFQIVEEINEYAIVPLSNMTKCFPLPLINDSVLETRAEKIIVTKLVDVWSHS